MNKTMATIIMVKPKTMSNNTQLAMIMATRATTMVTIEFTSIGTTREVISRSVSMSLV